MEKSRITAFWKRVDRFSTVFFAFSISLFDLFRAFTKSPPFHTNYIKFPQINQGEAEIYQGCGLDT